MGRQGNSAVGSSWYRTLLTPAGVDDEHYKWIALSNTTLGVLMATIDLSIVLIALPDVFRGIHLTPLTPGNTFYLLWMILGFMVVTSVLVVSLGRLGDMYGRVKMYNLGFAVYTFFSLMLAICWLTGPAGAMYLVIMRIFQGVGAAFLLANSSAILTDAFPEHQRGMALGINQVAGISGSFIGLVLGGLLGPINWRLIFLVSVPVGLVGRRLVLPMICAAVSVIGAAGARFDPGAGLAITTGVLEGGNQETLIGELSFSHGRTAALTSALPEPSRPGSVTARVGPLSASCTLG